MTNYEKIKSMSVEEMAEEFMGECWACKLEENQTCDNTSCKQGVRQWLESEVKE